MLLFPVIAAVRVSRRVRGAGRGEVASDFGMTRPGPLNELLTRLFAAEAGLVAHGRLPVGVSLLALAERAASTEP
jgi:hypothetical protein